MPGIAWLGVAGGIGGGLALQTVDQAAQGNIVIKGTVSQGCYRRESQGKQLGFEKNLQKIYCVIGQKNFRRDTQCRNHDGIFTSSCIIEAPF